MATNLTYTLWNEADSLLKLAELEMSKPMGSRLTHLICQNARLSLINYMKAFLHENNIMPSEPFTPESLKFQCIGIKELFDDLDLSCLNCRFEVVNEDHCHAEEKLRECIIVSRKVKKIAKS